MTTSPFKFLDSYTKEDKDIFFGRESEIEKLYSLVFESKTLLVYGVSGTGKSSLIHCGLANKFNEADWLPINIRRGSDMMESFWMALEKTALTPLKKPEKLTAAKFKKAIQSIYLDHFKPVFFIFDQFEELFVFGSDEEQKEFLSIVKSVTESDLQTRFVFVIREEYLAWFTEFESEIPTILDNRLRIEKMTRENARQAIEGPSQLVNIEVEEDFSQTLLQKLSPNQNQVELTYLQVYLDKLYRMAQNDVGKDEQLHFTKNLIDQSGNISDLLGSFLEEQIAQLVDPNAGLKVLKAFVSTKGTKRQINIQETQNYIKTLGADLPQEQISKLITQFVNLRILRDKDEADRFELRHDALAAKIFEKITLAEKELLEIRQFIEHAYDNYQKREILLSQEDLGYVGPFLNKLFLEKKHKLFLEESKKELLKAKKRRQLIIASLAITLFLIMAGFSWWAISERKKAEQKEIEFKAMYYDAIAKDIAEDDPTQALRMAEFAYHLDSSNKDIYQDILDIYYENNLVKKVFDFESNYNNEIIFSYESKKIVLTEKDTIFVLKEGVIVNKYAIINRDIADVVIHPKSYDIYGLERKEEQFYLSNFTRNSSIALNIEDSFAIERLTNWWDSFQFARRNLRFSPNGKSLIMLFEYYEEGNPVYNSFKISLVNGEMKHYSGIPYWSDNENVMLKDNKLYSTSNGSFLHEFYNCFYVDLSGEYILVQDKAENYSIYNFSGKLLYENVFNSIIARKIRSINFRNKTYTVFWSNEEYLFLEEFAFNGTIMNKINIPMNIAPRRSIFSRDLFSLENHIYYNSGVKLYSFERRNIELIDSVELFSVSKNGDFISLLKDGKLKIIDKDGNNSGEFKIPLQNKVKKMTIKNDGRLYMVDAGAHLWSIGKSVESKILTLDTMRIIDVFFGGKYFYMLVSHSDTIVKNGQITFVPLSSDYIIVFDYNGQVLNEKWLHPKERFFSHHHFDDACFVFSNAGIFTIQDTTFQFFGKENTDFTFYSYFTRRSKNIYSHRFLDFKYPWFNTKLEQILLFNPEEESLEIYSVEFERLYSRSIAINTTFPTSFNYDEKFKRYQVYGYPYLNFVDTNLFIHNRIKQDDMKYQLIGEKLYYNSNDNLYRRSLKNNYQQAKEKESYDPLIMETILEYNMYSLELLYELQQDYPLVEQFTAISTFLDKNKSKNLKELKQYRRSIFKEINLLSLSPYSVFSFVEDEPDLFYQVIERYKTTLKGNKLEDEETIAQAANFRSYHCIEKEDFKKALAYANLARMADSNFNLLYTNLALSYLLTNKWNQAKEIYESYQDSIYLGNEKTCKQGFLEDLDEMERIGITHPDFQKVRELLGATKEKEETTANEP